MISGTVRNLYRELNEELLLDSRRLLRKDATLGVDRVNAAEYEANLEETIKQPFNPVSEPADILKRVMLSVGQWDRFYLTYDNSP